MWSKRRLRRGARNSPFRLCIQLSIKDMKFDWHAEKAANNLSKHGIDFEDAIGIFEGPVLEFRSRRSDEERWIAIGRVRPPGDHRRLHDEKRNLQNHLSQEGE